MGANASSTTGRSATMRVVSLPDLYGGKICAALDRQHPRDLFDVHLLLKHEGLCLGGSSGINVAGAIRLARDLGPGRTVVTVLCDSGTRYQSKMFNPAFLKSKNLPWPDWLEDKP